MNDFDINKIKEMFDNNVDSIDIINHLINTVEKYKLQRNFIAMYVVMHCNDHIPCPYSVGRFDQTKKCPYWTPYSGNVTKDDDFSTWKEKVFPQTEDDFLDCSTNIYTCLKRAAEDAFK